MTDKDFYMMGIKNCMSVVAQAFVRAGPSGIMQLLQVHPDKFDAIASAKYDEHKDAFIKIYQKDLEAANHDY